VQKATFRAFAFAKVFNKAKTSSAWAISFSIDSKDNPTSLSCVIVDRRYVLISFSREKQRSPEATVTGIVI